MTTYDTYLSRADVVTYLTASPRATAFLALDADTQDQWLVEATRELNAEEWAGTPTESYPDEQPLAWPRDGIDGVTDGTTPQAILDGFAELVLALYLNAALIDQANTGNNVKSVIAKGVGVEFFGPSQDTATRFPARVQRLIGRYLGSSGASALAVGAASGTCERSQFTACHDFDLTDGG